MVQWLAPWWSTTESPALASGYERELAAELGMDHPLFGLPLSAVAKHDGTDDVLFQLLDGSGRVAVVHLTWARRPEPSPWPGFELFQSLEAFEVARMQPDHDEFVK